MTENAAVEASIHKLLLLGAGASGKSTLFKQIVKLYGEGLSESDKRALRWNIYHNIISSIQALCEETTRWGDVVSTENACCIPQILELKPTAMFTPEIGLAVTRLWKDPGVRSVYEKARFHLPDTTPYFFDRIPDVCDAEYIPSDLDALHCRVPTTGIVEYTFDMDNVKFKLLDLGGQRSERKKWVHCFESVTAVLFVAAINEYDLVLFEDEFMNRLQEALDLFEGIVNNEWFRNTAMILFLNKSDLFIEKIPKIPLSEYFPAFKGDNTSFKETTDFIKTMFVDKTRGQREIFTHITCATDSNSVASVFGSVKATIVKHSSTRAQLV